MIHLMSWPDTSPKHISLIHSRPLVSSMERSNVNEILSSTSNNNSETGVTTVAIKSDETEQGRGMASNGGTSRLHRKGSKYRNFPNDGAKAAGSQTLGTD